MKTISRPDQSVLGLSHTETSILVALAKQSPASISNLARLTKIPRTTVTFLLGKLKKRQLVEKIKVNNHFEWQALESNTVSKRLVQAINKFNIQHEAAKSISSENLVKVFTGRKGLENAYKLMLEAGEDRIHFIQGHHSAVKSSKRLDQEFLDGLNEQVRQQGVILECLLGRGSLDVFHTFSIAELESSLDRRVILYLIPDKYINFDLDIVIINDVIAFIDPAQATTILLTNPVLSSALKQLSDFMKSCATKIDLNAFLRDLIKRKREAEI